MTARELDMSCRCGRGVGSCEMAVVAVSVVVVVFVIVVGGTSGRVLSREAWRSANVLRGGPHRGTENAHSVLNPVRHRHGH